MRKTFTRVSIAIAAMATTVAFNSCVDDEYDLSEDIDLEVSVGGNLTLPASSTEVLTLDQILDLKPDASIKAVEVEGDYGLSVGDYVLLQDGKSDPATFTVDRVDLTGLTGSSSTFDLPQFYVPSFLPEGQDRITREVTSAVNSITISDDNITKEVVAISKAEMAVDFTLNVEYKSANYSGSAIIENGYVIEFDPSWTLEIVDNATAQFLTVDDNHIIRFTKSYTISPEKPLFARIRLSEVDFSKAQEGQGLYAPGHFRMESEVESRGEISILLSELMGSVADVDLITMTNIENASILSVTGKVDPKINIDPTSFSISDIPDFLSDNENNLDIDNPQINFTVNNNSPLTLDLSGVLTSYKEDAELTSVSISGIVVEANASTEIVISRLPVNKEGVENVVIENLSELISTIPDEISFHDLNCKARQDDVTFILGSTFTFDAKYEAIIPLAFGSQMRLHYTETVDDWDVDLEDYNFSEVLLTFDAVSSLPLTMTPEVIALDREGNHMSNIIVNIENDIKPGTLATPSTTPLSISLKSTGNSIEGLDGIYIIFDAVAAEGFIGENLNKNQSLRFDNIKITLVDGVLINLND